MGSRRLYYSWLLMARHRSTSIICLGFWLNEGGVECELGPERSPLLNGTTHVPPQHSATAIVENLSISHHPRLHLHTCMLLLLLLLLLMSSIYQMKLYSSKTVLFRRSGNVLLVVDLPRNPHVVQVSHQRSFGCLQRHWLGSVSQCHPINTCCMYFQWRDLLPIF